MLNLLTIWTIRILELSTVVNNVLIDILDDLRIRKGMPPRKMEETLTESQIWALAMSLKLTKRERFDVSKLTNKVVFRNFPWLSRRQAAKVLETFKMTHKSARKMSA